MREMRRLEPREKIFLVCRAGLGDLFHRTGLVDRVFEVRKGQQETYDQVAAELQKEDIRYLISPHESWRTALFVRSIPAEKKISFAKFGKKIVFDRLEKKNKSLPEALRQLSLLSSVSSELRRKIESVHAHAMIVPDEQGFLPPPPEWASMSIRAELLRDEKTWLELKNRLGLSDKGKRILIFPGSVWATKRWTESGYERTGQELIKAGHRILVMGAPEEKTLAEKVARHIPGSESVAARTSIYESLILMAHSDVVVGNDSAAIHMASAAAIPVISVFGPTVLEFGFRPWNERAAVVEIKGLACRPCGKHGHRKCPIGTHECMRHIPAEEVLRRIRPIL